MSVNHLAPVALALKKEMSEVRRTPKLTPHTSPALVARTPGKSPYMPSKAQEEIALDSDAFMLDSSSASLDHSKYTIANIEILPPTPVGIEYAQVNNLVASGIPADDALALVSKTQLVKVQADPSAEGNHDETA